MTAVKQARTRYPAEGGSVDLRYDFEISRSPPPGPRQNNYRIPSPFAYLRNRKRSGDSKSLSASRSFESFDSLKKPPDIRALPPVPRLPSDYSDVSTPQSNELDYQTSSSGQSSATLSSPANWQSTRDLVPLRPPEFPTPNYYEPEAFLPPRRQSSLTAPEPRFSPLRRNTDDNSPAPIITTRSDSPEQIDIASPMEKTLNQQLDRHGRDIINSATVFDRQLAQNLFLANELKEKQADAKVIAKLGKKIFAGTQHLARAQTLLETAAASTVWQTGKAAATTLLQPAKELLPILDVVTQYLPVVIVAKSVFAAIVKVEVDRHDNDKNVAIVYLTMSTFWFTLFN